MMSFSPRLPWLLGGLLALVCLLIYRHVPGFGFMAFDDDYNIAFNPHLGPLSVARWQWAFTDVDYVHRYLPLGWLGFSAVFSLSGLNPAGYHLVGVGLHVANTLLFFSILRKLVAGKAEAGALSLRAEAGAFLAAAFWAWHPLRVESVAWASSLLYMQAVFLLLASMHGFLRSSASIGWRAGAVGLYALSLLTYPVALGFPPVLVLLAVWRGEKLRRALLTVLPFAVIAAVVLAVTVYARGRSGAGLPPMPSLTEFPLGMRAFRSCFVAVYYLWKPFWPFGLTPVNSIVVDFNPWSAASIGSAVFLGAAVTACLVSRRWRMQAGPFLLAHLCVIVPLVGLTELSYFPSDRYAVLPQGVMAVALALGLMRLRDGWSKPVLMALGGTLAVLSAKQTAIWRDEQTLMEYINAGMAPEKFPRQCYVRPAVLLYRNGDAVAALALLDRGIARLPHERLLREARVDLERQSREHQAHLAEVGGSRLIPPVALLHEDLGVAAAKAGDIEAAIAHLEMARRLAPDFVEPAYNLALLWLRQGQPHRALACYLWAEKWGGAYLKAPQRAYALGVMAEQLDAAGEHRLAAAALQRSLNAR